MLQKKVCMIGDFSVGKTSLISRFVRQSFSEKYLTTVGVKIDTKIVELDKETVKLILWDIAGNDALTTTAISYLRGSAGYLLVVDSTRLPTWESALNLREAVAAQIGEKPFVMLLNKTDLQEQWELDKELIQQYITQGWHILHTSAKTGMNVEEAFATLANLMVQA
jgi:hypothetical protein